MEPPSSPPHGDVGPPASTLPTWSPLPPPQPPPPVGPLPLTTSPPPVVGPCPDQEDDDDDEEDDEEEVLACGRISPQLPVSKGAGGVGGGSSWQTPPRPGERRASPLPRRLRQWRQQRRRLSRRRSQRGLSSVAAAERCYRRPSPLLAMRWRLLDRAAVAAPRRQPTAASVATAARRRPCRRYR